MKKYTLLLVIVAIFCLISVLVFVGCGETDKSGEQIIDNPSTNNDNNTSTEITVSEVLDNHLSDIKSFITNVVNEVKENYEYLDDDILFIAYNVNNKEATKINKVTVYVTEKGEGTERLFKTHTCTFNEISVKDLLESKVVLSDLVIDTTTDSYDAKEKQNDETFLSRKYSNYDVIVKAYQKEVFNEEPQDDIVISDIDTLLEDYTEEAKTFGDSLAQATMKKYNSTEAIFVGYSFDGDEEGYVNGIHVYIVTKTGETERTYSTYKILFDSIKLDSIADGSYSISNAKSSLENTSTYDAKEKQSAEVRSELYAPIDLAYVDYEGETFEEEQNPDDNPQQDPPQDPQEDEDITIEKIISDYADVVIANLEPILQGVLKKAFGKAYGNEARFDIESYQWYLGELVEDQVQNLKLTISYFDNTFKSLNLRVYSAVLAQPVALIDLIDADTFYSIKASYNDMFTVSYTPSIQGTRTELTNAILEAAITDGFDYQNAEIIFKENSASTTSNLGTVRNFIVVVKNNAGIIQISFGIQTASNDEKLIAKIQNGKYLYAFDDSVTYSSNLLAECVIEASGND